MKDLDALASTVATKLTLRASIALDATVRPEASSFDATALAPSKASAELLSTLPRLSLRTPEAGVVEPAGPAAELELGTLLGQGGMGAVWQAHQRSLRRDVAVKVPASSPEADASMALLAEARVVGGLEHPHIVPIHVLGVDDEARPVLVMKRVEGVTLATLAADRSHPAWDALLRRHGDAIGVFLEVLMRVADALELAHARGVVHRDVKPDNVMVGRFGEVYLLDWGVAHDPAASAPIEGIVGTPVYLAPELVRGAPPDPRTDVYLLGATLHALVTGRPRHDGDTLEQVLRAALESAPVEYGDDVPPELARLCNEATARDPEARPASVGAFREELGLVLRRRALVKMALDVEARASGAGVGLASLYEARHALAALLREWRENVVARSALQRILRGIVASEIDRGNVPEAEGALREVDPPRAELEEILEALRKKVAESKRLLDVGLREERENDWSPSLRALAAVLVVGGIASAILMVMLREDTAPTMWTVAKYDGVFLAVITAVGVALRKRLLANRRGRLAAFGLFIVLVGTSICDLFSAVSGLSPERAAPYSLLTMALGLAACGLTIGRRFVAAAALILVAAGASLAWPSLAFAAVNVALLITLVASVSVMVTAARGAASPPAG